MSAPSSHAIAFAKNGGRAGEKVLTSEALGFLAKLHDAFSKERHYLISERRHRQELLNSGAKLDFLSTTKEIRNDPSWKVSLPPSDLKRRWVEITGPTDSKMMINALNSGADVFMADFEDANSPTWQNMLEGQGNLIDAIEGSLSYTSPEGKNYLLKEKVATLFVRPRGWHLNENHLIIDGEPISASLFDFGLAFFHNAKTLLKNGSGPYFYLPKLENHLEARLWNDVFLFAQRELNIPKGSIRATVLIETITAAFEMEEILYELREHVTGLNAGRWDYIFSIIKKFEKHDSFIFPDRSEITMRVPFMNAYTTLLIQTCQKRGAYAIGGMAAFIPNRKDSKVNEIALRKVREDKLRESKEGFDGSWVAHPDLVPLVNQIFAEELHGHSHQIHKQVSEQRITADDLLNFTISGSKITDARLRQNINISLQYLAAWLSGTGAAALNNLMEDTATAEISRSQIWQWIHHSKGFLENGVKITPELYTKLADEEMSQIKNLYPQGYPWSKNLTKARQILDDLVLKREFVDFLTNSAYACLD